MFSYEKCVLKAITRLLSSVFIINLKHNVLLQKIRIQSDLEASLLNYVPYVALVYYMSRTLRAFVSHVLSCLMCFMLYVLSCPTSSSASRGLHLGALVPCALRESYLKL